MPTVSGKFLNAGIVSVGSPYVINSGTVGNMLTLDGVPQAYNLVPTGASGSTSVIKVYEVEHKVPTDATITAITITVRKQKGATTTSVVDGVVKLVRAGTLETTDNASASEFPASYANTTYGGDLWGAAWTPADINDAGWGVAVSADIDDTAVSDGGLAYWDFIGYSIDYTAPTPPVSGTTDTYHFDGGTYHRSADNRTGVQEAPMQGDRPPSNPYMGLPTNALIERTFTEFLKVSEEEQE